MDIHRTVSEKIAKAASDEMDRELLKFFGSYENAKRNAHLYILEHHVGVVKETKNSVSVSTTYRIRKKTKKELEDG